METWFFFFTSNLVSSLDPAFVDRCYIENEIKAPAAECAFEILRLEINELINRGAIIFERLLFENSPDLSGSDDAFSEAHERHASALGRVGYHQTLSDIPSRQWASMHWPCNATTAVSELFRIARLGNGLSGRKLKGLVTCARYKYLVDDPGDLRDLLNALEEEIREKTQQRSGDAKTGSDRVDGSQSRMGAAEEDMEKFLAELEACGQAGRVGG